MQYKRALLQQNNRSVRALPDLFRQAILLDRSHSRDTTRFKSTSILKASKIVGEYKLSEANRNKT